MRLILACFAFLIFIRCQTGPKEYRNVKPLKKTVHLVDNRLMAILDSLSVPYVLNVRNSDNLALLNFYGIKKTQFKSDSVRYENAVFSFFHADRSIIEELEFFIKDSSSCGWTFSPNPLSSQIRSWELKFSNEDGAMILMYDYIINTCTGKNKITVDPGQIEELMNNVDLRKISDWFKENKNLGKKEFCEKFEREKEKWRVAHFDM